METPQHLVVMGVAGSGKTTLARDLARRWRRTFCEGDDLHSQANRDAMAAGTPLTDVERGPWLASIRDWMSSAASRGEQTVVACSALRRTYRDVLRQADGEVWFIHALPSAEVVRQRITRRRGHFMPAALLQSQLDLLEPLEEDEPGVVVDSDGSPRQVVEEAVRRLGLALGTR